MKTSRGWGRVIHIHTHSSQTGKWVPNNGPFTRAGVCVVEMSESFLPRRLRDLDALAMKVVELLRCYLRRFVPHGADEQRFQANPCQWCSCPLAEQRRLSHHCSRRCEGSGISSRTTYRQHQPAQANRQGHVIVGEECCVLSLFCSILRDACLRPPPSGIVPGIRE